MDKTPLPVAEVEGVDILQEDEDPHGQEDQAPVPVHRAVDLGGQKRSEPDAQERYQDGLLLILLRDYFLKILRFRLSDFNIAFLLLVLWKNKADKK